MSLQAVDPVKVMKAFDNEDHWIACGLWLYEELRWNVSLVFEAMEQAKEREQRVMPTKVRLQLLHLGALYGFPSRRILSDEKEPNR